MWAMLKKAHTQGVFSKCEPPISKQDKLDITYLRGQVAAAITELNKEDSEWTEIWGILPLSHKTFTEGQSAAAHYRQTAIKILEGLLE